MSTFLESKNNLLLISFWIKWFFDSSEKFLKIDLSGYEYE